MSRRSFTKAAACMAAGTIAMATGPASFPANAFAAATSRCYTVSSSNTPVYGSPSLSDKPVGAVYGTDEVRINSFSADKAAASVTYPLSNGRGYKTGWVRTGTVLSATGGYGYRSKARFTTYKRPGGGSYGAKQVTMVEGNTSSDQVKRNTYTINPGKAGLITKGYSGHYLCGYISVS